MSPALSRAEPITPSYSAATTSRRAARRGARILGISNVPVAGSSSPSCAWRIPAIKIGSGGSGGRAHSLEEWIDVAAGLAALLAVAGGRMG